MSKTTVSASAIGLPECTAPKNNSYSVPMAALNRLGMKELADVRDVLCTAHTVLSAFLCQPRFNKDDENNFNCAGNVLDEFVLLIHGFEEILVGSIRASRPATSDEAEEKAWALLGFEADMRDNLADLAVLAAEAVRDAVNAERSGGKQ